jgi:hypothetical protein
MKTIKNYFRLCYLLVPFLFLSGSCKKLGLQTNYDYHPDPPDTLLHMNAWEYMNAPRPDTLFAFMLAGVKYAGLEEEYSKPGRTFIFLTNTSIYSVNAAGVVNAACYFGKNKVNNQPAAKWQDYPVQQVRDLFLYHIIPGGEYSYNNLTLENTVAPTLLDNTDIKLKIAAGTDSRMDLNDFTGTKKAVLAVTANLKPTNGIIHVVDAYLEH